MGWKSGFDGKIPNYSSGQVYQDTRIFLERSHSRSLQNIFSLVFVFLSAMLLQRVFSYMKAIKSKQQNYISFGLYIVRIRTELNFKGRCCKDLSVTDKILELFNAKQMYEEELTKKAIMKLSNQLHLIFVLLNLVTILYYPFDNPFKSFHYSFIQIIKVLWLSVSFSNFLLFYFVSFCLCSSWDLGMYLFYPVVEFVIKGDTEIITEYTSILRLLMDYTKFTFPFIWWSIT